MQSVDLETRGVAAEYKDTARAGCANVPSLDQKTGK